jgi:hypothetical protein
MASGPMTNEDQNRSRPYRRFGVVRHTFHDLTPTEKAFIVAFGVFGLIAAFFAGKSMRGPAEAIVAFSGCIMGPVLAYWMRYEPATVLQIFLFPFTGHSPKWPRIVLMSVRAFGIVALFSSLFSLPLVFLPASCTKSPICQAALITIALGISIFALRKRSRI